MPCFFHKIVFSLRDTITIVWNNPHHVLSQPFVIALPPYQYDLWKFQETIIIALRHIDIMNLLSNIIICSSYHHNGFRHVTF
jgi:hypothetical protein